MMNSIILHPNDSVAVVTVAISKGEDVTYIYDGKEIATKAIDDIPAYHKIAIKNIKNRETVLKYGEVIGYATDDIKAGNHVHTQNLSDLVIKAGEKI